VATKPHILVAARPLAFDILHGYLDDSMGLVTAETLDQALRRLEERHDIDLVITTVNFDESRMFDLLRLVTAKYRGIPVVCCRAFDVDASRISVEALRIASEALGAAQFVDLPSMGKRVGKKRLAGEFKAVVLKHLRNR
jgi:DNA-binding NtrC family response regulator